MTPAEVRQHLMRAALLPRDLRGFSLKRNPVGAVFGYLRRRDIGGFRATSEPRFVIVGDVGKALAPGPGEGGRGAG